MKRVQEFIGKPRNIYFSIILMLTVVTGLASISFSYYIDDSNTASSNFDVEFVDTRIQSDELNDDTLTLAPNEKRELDINVISNNKFTSVYKLYYKTPNNVSVTTLNEDYNLGAKDVKKVTLTITNNEDKEVIVSFGVKGGKINTDIKFAPTELAI